LQLAPIWSRNCARIAARVIPPAANSCSLHVLLCCLATVRRPVLCIMFTESNRPKQVAKPPRNEKPGRRPQEPFSDKTEGEAHSSTPSTLHASNRFSYSSTFNPRRPSYKVSNDIPSPMDAKAKSLKQQLAPAKADVVRCHSYISNMERELRIARVVVRRLETRSRKLKLWLAG
jgi:hypothetical protein